MTFTRSICAALSFILVVQAVGCHSVHTLKSSNDTETHRHYLYEGAFVRLVLKSESDLPFKERDITCRIVKTDRRTITIESVSIQGVDSGKRFEIRIDDIRKVETLQRKLSGKETGLIVGLALVLLLVFVISQIEIDVPDGSFYGGGS